MPMLSAVLETLGDPLLVDYQNISYTRFSQSVNNDGIATNTGTTYPLTASIQAAKGATLILLPDGARVDSAIDVYTTTRLLAQTDSTAADQVNWQGRQYMVTSVQDWKAWGAGHVVATCELVQLTQPGPP